MGDDTIMSFCILLGIDTATRGRDPGTIASLFLELIDVINYFYLM